MHHASLSLSSRKWTNQQAPCFYWTGANGYSEEIMKVIEVLGYNPGLSCPMLCIWFNVMHFLIRKKQLTSN